MTRQVPEDQQIVNPLEEGRGKPSPLKGLAKFLEEDSSIRQHALNNQALLKWPKPDRVGVITNSALKLNSHVIEKVLTIWCPNAPDRKTTPVGFLKREVGALGGVINNQKGIQKLVMFIWNLTPPCFFNEKHLSFFAGYPEGQGLQEFTQPSRECGTYTL